jgi:hypothetical protein
LNGRLFSNGGVAGMTTPGEMRLSSDALKAIANGINSNQNISMSMRTPSKPAATTSQQRVFVDISLNQNAAEIINAQLREGQNLGTINPV